jgi:hypothetical protein
MAHRVNLLQRSVCLLAKEQRTKRSSRASRDAGARSLHIENDTNDALDLLKPLWSEREGNFDPAIHGSVNVEDEPRRSEFDQAHTEVSGTPVGLVRLDIADASIVILELALNEEIGLQWCGQIKVRARVLRVERDLEVLIGEVVDRHVGCV